MAPIQKTAPQANETAIQQVKDDLKDKVEIKVMSGGIGQGSVKNQYMDTLARSYLKNGDLQKSLNEANAAFADIVKGTEKPPESAFMKLVPSFLK
jgi:hypothetical protein